MFSITYTEMMRCYMTGDFDLHTKHMALIEYLQFDTLPISFALIAVIRPLGDVLQS